MSAKSIKVVVGGNEAPITTKRQQPTAFQSCLLLGIVDRSLRADITHQLKPFKLTISQWLLLGAVALADDAGISIQDTARTLNVTASQVTTLSSQLVSSHLLRQKRTQRDDRRSRHLLLTARGQALLEGAEESVNKVLKKWFKSIPENHRIFYWRVNEMLASQRIARPNSSQS